MEAKDLTRSIALQLERLSDLERLVLALRYVEELDEPDAAAVLGLSERAVRKLERLALSHLRESLRSPVKGSSRPSAAGAGEAPPGGEPYQE